jgi:glycerol-3-phosphate acyltransferase PlsX
MIAVDVMSGEHHHEAYIKGAVNAIRELNVKLALVGDEEIIETALKKLKFEDSRKLKVFHADEVIRMHEIPSVAVKKKKNASIQVCTRLVKEGVCEGLWSAGNTGATLISAIMHIGKIEGIHRPAISTYLPTLKGHCMLIDAGGNVDCIPEYLAQFAVMGEVFANKVQGKKNPSVGLLSIGSEKSKGNELVLKTYDILKELDFNFIGNIEGYDISDGDVDVVVCDGFVGNIVLKVTERVFKLMIELVQQEIENHLLQRIGFAFLYPTVKKQVYKKTDPRAYGGAPVLGLNGNIFVGHGASDAYAAHNGIRMVNNLIKNKVNDLMVKRLQQFGLLKINTSEDRKAE